MMELAFASWEHSRVSSHIIALYERHSANTSGLAEKAMRLRTVLSDLGTGVEAGSLTAQMCIGVE